MKTTIIVNERDGMEYIQIEREDGSFEVMAKSRYDELQAKQETQGGIN